MPVKEKTTALPVHSLTQEEFPVCIRDIQYRNPYDFTREHRHDYFEIFFFEKGGGSQLIDFIEFPVEDHGCYIVFPRQVHLLKRGPEASGLLVQFREEVVPSAQIKNLLRQVSFGENHAVIFEHQPQKTATFQSMLRQMKGVAETKTSFSADIALHYLQALLLQLVESVRVAKDKTLPGERDALFAFQHLLDEKFADHHLVQHYTGALNIPEKKLAIITKKYLGLSPLQVIHNRLLLEAKRILLFENVSHKEIAFSLGFDSPASFSQFIRNKTGHTPSELSARLVDIHK